ncbi:ABC transporter transmembrane domain-containing protein [Streptomyces sp. NPDC002076]
MHTAAPATVPVAESGAGPAAGASSRIRHARISPLAAFRTFWPLVSVNRAAVLASAVLLLVSAGCDAGAIGIVGVLTDDVLTPGDLADFWEPAALWLGLAVAGAVASAAGGYLAGWTSEHFLLGLRDRVFQHLQRVPPDALDRFGTGDLVSRLTGDIESLGPVNLQKIHVALPEGPPAMTDPVATALLRLLRVAITDPDQPHADPGDA